MARTHHSHPKIDAAGLKRARACNQHVKGGSIWDPAFRRQVSEAHRRFFATRLRDVDSFGFSGGFAG